MEGWLHVLLVYWVTQMDFFMWGHLIILSLPGQSKDLMARLQAAVTVVDGNML